MSTKSIMTVRGPIDRKALGYTLTHEHLSMVFDHFYRAPPAGLEEYTANKISLQNVGFVRQYPYSCKYNLNFEDEDTHRAVLNDLKMYRSFGGGSIVENSSHGLNRNLKFLYEVSKETGVHVIAGTGHYINGVQPESVTSMSTEQLCDLYTKEILFGVEVEGIDPEAGNIKCGVVGEVASCWPISAFEKRAIQATAETQSVLNCPVTFHPHREKEAPFEIIRLYLEAGGRANRCVMSHLDRTLFDSEDLLEFAKLGTYCQFDLFGTECSYYQLNPSSYMQSDEQRLTNIAKLVAEGFEKQILMSHDIHTKHRLIDFGGHGYSHILNNVLMRFSAKGISSDTVDTITVSNPADWLEMTV
ncbi:phosphotriesterase-related protein [Uranotaenia lowii]|uniref:phosphotriesterase-related protein n=1 Tax=Uranotaenia lowii TaxID=190385 RepID=UPI00247A7E32|nr:phosphotriesterase-related protein [Uranotaenia lowii]